MIICPSCGQETPEGFPRCANCGAPVGDAAPARRERKVVTVLFADLVGSTAKAERLDPEEVDARLRSYHARVRQELERYGGTVEKFIGDAVVALFGAPVAHEDDPERAVRAALAIRDWAREEEDLQVRVAVNTGEALVTLGARTSEGEGMAAGDVVNTAARLQGAAPVNGVLVGEQTYRATERMIVYAEREPVVAKGKSEPVPIWEALEARSRLGVDVSQESRAPLVGRQRERDLLLGALERVIAEREPQLVTLIGVPGIGKSRLVYELLAGVRDNPDDIVYWRQGRSLPYGEGVAFWAFAEMVKAQAGILETDTRDEAAGKLHEAVAELCAEEAAWVERALRPLVGVAAEAGHDSREASFAAWRRLVEGMADARPTVLVFEDLHWADDGLLDFVDTLVDDATGVPLLCVCTARPELLERRANWGGGKVNSTTIGLAPLSDAETQRLLAGLVGRELLPAELLQFAGGNPLYAEEYARMLADRGIGDAALPQTVQGIIAARLDALSTDEKAAIQNAAVFGKVFWSGSLTALAGGDAAGVDQCLRALARKEFVRRERRSSVGGQEEYAFRHVLVRDVAYGQIPRTERAEKHRRAAEWIDSLSERTEDLADLLAHHYVSALEYGAPDLGDRAAQALREAGRRAADLHSYAPALRYYRAALDLVPPDNAAARGEILLAIGHLRFYAETEGTDELTEAVALLEPTLPDRAAEAHAYLAILKKNDHQRSVAHYERAVELVRDQPPTRSKGLVLSAYGSQLLLANRYARGIELVREALAIAEALGDTEGQAQSLLGLGNLRLNLGEPDGLAEMERALALALESNSVAAAQRAYGNLADAVASHLCELERCFELQLEGRRLAERIGMSGMRHFFTGERVTELYIGGRWGEAVEMAAGLLEDLSKTANPHFIQVPTRSAVARIALGRGDVERADSESQVALERGRAIGDLQVLYSALAARAVVLLESGRHDDARALVDEFVDHQRSELDRTGNVYVPWAERLTLVWLCHLHGYGPTLSALLDAVPRWNQPSPWTPMMARVLRGDLAEAAALAEERLLLVDAAYLRLKSGTGLERALDFYRRAGATRYAADAEMLLAKSA